MLRGSGSRNCALLLMASMFASIGQSAWASTERASLRGADEDGEAQELGERSFPSSFVYSRLFEIATVDGSRDPLGGEPGTAGHPHFPILGATAKPSQSLEDSPHTSDLFRAFLRSPSPRCPVGGGSRGAAPVAEAFVGVSASVDEIARAALALRDILPEGAARQVEEVPGGLVRFHALDSRSGWEKACPSEPRPSIGKGPPANGSLADLLAQPAVQIRIAFPPLAEVAARLKPAIYVAYEFFSPPDVGRVARDQPSDLKPGAREAIELLGQAR